MKILIVEDDRNYRAMLYDYLHHQGHDVLAVSDAVHAVALLNEHSHEIALVLMDLSMPRLTGSELLESFAHWNNVSTRFVVVSGFVDPAQFANHPKIVACLQKPFPFEQLGEIVSKVAKMPQLKAQPMPAGATRSPFARAS
jgi:two-component system, cell cycle sensor histidine kinase and response regulator CckA